MSSIHSKLTQIVTYHQEKNQSNEEDKKNKNWKAELTGTLSKTLLWPCSWFKEKHEYNEEKNEEYKRELNGTSRAEKYQIWGKIHQVRLTTDLTLWKNNWELKHTVVETIQTEAPPHKIT